MSDAANGVPAGPSQVESTIQFDTARNIVIVTPKKVNGVSVVNPVSSVFTVDQWLEIAAKCILGRAMDRAKAAGQARGLISLKES